MSAVVLGRKILVPYVATHWAVKVGDTWYEVEGASKNDSNKENKIKTSYGSVAASGAAPIGGGLVGTTTKTTAQIESWKQQWLHRNPYYDFTTTNCQKFVKEFCDFLCDGTAKLIKMEAGTRGYGQAPGAWSAAEDGTAAAEATAGLAEAQHGIANAQAEGPSARARALCGREGFGAFAEASAGRAEGNLGPIGVRLEPNINTGAGMRNGNLEGNLLGFGGAVGQDGVRINTPLGGANCTVM